MEILDNSVLCPYLGNATVETRDAMDQVAAKNIIAVLNEDKAVKCINPEIYD